MISLLPVLLVGLGCAAVARRRWRLGGALMMLGGLFDLATSIVAERPFLIAVAGVMCACAAGVLALSFPAKDDTKS